MNVIQSNTQIGQCSVLQNLREPCIAAIKPLRPLRIVSVARCIIEESEWGVSEVFGPHKKRRQVLPPSPPPPLLNTVPRNNDSEATHFSHLLSFKNMTILSLYLVSGFL